MDYEIIWAVEAKENYRAAISYLLDEYSFEVADRFTDKVSDKLTLLKKTPFIGRRLNILPSVRKLPIEPYTMLYYAVVEKQVIILNILDTRQAIL